MRQPLSHSYTLKLQCTFYMTTATIFTSRWPVTETYSHTQPNRTEPNRKKYHSLETKAAHNASSGREEKQQQQKNVTIIQFDLFKTKRAKEATTSVWILNRSVEWRGEQMDANDLNYIFFLSSLACCYICCCQCACLWGCVLFSVRELVFVWLPFMFHNCSEAAFSSHSNSIVLAIVTPFYSHFDKIHAQMSVNFQEALQWIIMRRRWAT